MMRAQRALTAIGTLLVLIAAAPALAVAETGAASVFYLSLGTSLSVGVQPNPAGQNRRTQEGYADQLHAALNHTMPNLRLVKLGCPGETTVTMIIGGTCAYDQGSQLAQAVRFLQDHQGSVTLVTIDMGANDIEPCGSLGGIDPACVAQAFANVGGHLPYILSVLREAAGPDAPIVGMNYYNPFLAAWFVNPTLAEESRLGLLFFNALLGGIYTAFSVPVADVAGAFHAGDPFPDAGIPLNVLLVCQWTWMCAPSPVGPNIHANVEGYGVIAGAFLTPIGE